MKPAFSTVACPDWTLPVIAQRAGAWGYPGVELRTFGHDSSMLACDPALSSWPKVRAMFDAAGVQIACLATSIAFDEPLTIDQRVLGGFLGRDPEAALKQAKGAIDIAIALEAPFVRVFGFQDHPGHSRLATVNLIADRLGHAMDYARSSGVRLLLETGGAFGTAVAVSEILDAVGGANLSICYNAPLARAMGESPADGVNVLGDRLAAVRVSDTKDKVPCPLGRGDEDHAALVSALSSGGFGGWLIYDYPRLWTPALQGTDPAPILEDAARTMFSWLGAARGPARTKARV